MLKEAALFQVCDSTVCMTENLFILLDQKSYIRVSVVGINIAESKSVLFPDGICGFCMFVILDLYAVDLFAFL